MAGFDPRITPARPDLAARHLEGKVTAARFVDGHARDVIAPLAPVRKSPSHEAALETQALRGERVSVYESNGEGWCWGQLEADGYVGWLPEEALANPGMPPTHYVRALRTLIFSAPSIKIPPVGPLPLGARVTVVRDEAEFAVIADGGYVPRRHLAPLTEREPDFVDVAQRFLGTPYLWGGKSSEGIDCSGLVQVALTVAGVACPRDSDMQEQSLGRPIAISDDFSATQRGDLFFWPGHVAIACDGARIVHANAFHMAVAMETVSEAVTRISAAGSKIRSIRRL
jgi:hypothetical protein